MNDLSIEKRLEKLERSNKKLRFVNFLMLAIIFSGGLIGWQVTTQYFQTIETEKLVLKDKKGNIRATLNVDENNSTYLKFIDSSGNELVVFGIKENEYGLLEISDPSSNVDASKTFISSGNIQIGSNDVLYASLSKDTDGAGLRLYDKSGFPQIGMVSNQSLPGFFISDSGKAGTLLGKGFLNFYKDTVTIMQLQANDNIRYFAFNDSLEMPLLQIANSTFLKGILIFGKNGERILKIGDEIFSDIRGIEFYDENGNSTALLGGYADGKYSTLQLFSENKALLYLTSRPERSMIAIDDKKEKSIVVIESGENYNSPSVGIAKNEKVAFHVGIDKNDYSYQYMFDKYGKLRFDISFTDYGKPAISLYDASGSRRGVFGATSIKYNNGTTKNHPESSIWLFNESGNGVFSAPNE